MLAIVVGEVLVRAVGNAVGDSKGGWRLMDAETPELRKEGTGQGGQRRVVLSFSEERLVLAGGAVGGGVGASLASCKSDLE